MNHIKSSVFCATMCIVVAEVDPEFKERAKAVLTCPLPIPFSLFSLGLSGPQTGRARPPKREPEPSRPPQPPWMSLICLPS